MCLLIWLEQGTLTWIFLPSQSGGGGRIVQKTVRGTGMCCQHGGSKISLLEYEWPLIKCKICYMNGSIFQNFLEFKPKLAQIQENFGKIRWFCSTFGPKLDRLVYEWVTFSVKIGICMYLLSNFVAAHLNQNQTWLNAMHPPSPPPPPPRYLDCAILCEICDCPSLTRPV